MLEALYDCMIDKNTFEMAELQQKTYNKFCDRLEEGLEPFL